MPLSFPQGDILSHCNKPDELSFGSSGGLFGCQQLTLRAIISDISSISNYFYILLPHASQRSYMWSTLAKQKIQFCRKD